MRAGFCGAFITTVVHLGSCLKCCLLLRYTEYIVGFGQEANKALYADHCSALMDASNGGLAACSSIWTFDLYLIVLIMWEVSFESKDCMQPGDKVDGSKIATIGRTMNCWKLQKSE